MMWIHDEGMPSMYKCWNCDKTIMDVAVFIKYAQMPANSSSQLAATGMSLFNYGVFVRTVYSLLA
jgi:hypothetical protein